MSGRGQMSRRYIRMNGTYDFNSMVSVNASCSFLFHVTLIHIKMFLQSLFLVICFHILNHIMY